MKEKIEARVNIRNKKAWHEYEMIDTWIAGIVLRGTEIKSVRMSKVNLQDAHCQVLNDQIFVINMHIGVYSHGTYNNHIPKADRKLLLKKKEIARIASKVTDQGITIIPLRIFINDRGFAKMEIALARGKKLYDKRADIKEKDIKREMDRANV